LKNADEIKLSLKSGKKEESLEWVGQTQNIWFVSLKMALSGFTLYMENISSFRSEKSFSIFHFPFSIFHFPFSVSFHRNAKIMELKTVGYGARDLWF